MPPLGLKLFDRIGLVRGLDLPDNVFNAEKPGNALGLYFLVAAYHPNVDTGGFELFYRVLCVGTNDLAVIGHAEGQGAGFVENNGVGLVCSLKLIAAAKQNAHFRRTSGACHDRRRRSKPERARAGNDKSGAHAVYRLSQVAFVSEKVPAAEHRRGDEHDDRDKHGGDLIGKPCDRRFFALRIAYDVDYLLKHCRFPYAAAREQHLPVAAQRSAIQRIARLLSYRLAFAGQHGFIGEALAVGDNAVYRNMVA